MNRPSSLRAAALTGLVSLAVLAPDAAASAQPGTPSTTQVSTRGDHLAAWWYDALHIDAAHRRTTGKGARVAIIDGGFDTRLPGFAGADVHFMRGCDGSPTHREKIDEYDDHGTQMLMFIAGNGRGPGADGLGYEGIAPGARVDLWPEQPTSCSDDEVRHQAVEAARAGADIISISEQVDADWGPALQKIASYGAVVVAGVGNKPQGMQTMIQPAASRGVVAVNAVDKTGKAWTGNAGLTQAMLDGGSGYPAVSAPGVKLPATAWFQKFGYDFGLSTGTSDSTAIVAGMLALVKSRYPDATANQLIQQLIHYTGGWQRGFGWDAKYGFGIASVTEMLKHDPTQWPDENPLLLTPAQVVKTYPMSVRGQEHVLDEPSPSAPSSAASTRGKRAAAELESSSSGAGVPAWAWGAAALVVLAAATGGLVLRRRRAPAGSAPQQDGQAARERQMQGD